MRVWSMSLPNISSIQRPPGYPVFVNLDSKHQCLVCKQVLHESQQTSCGHRLCKSCIEPFFNRRPEPVPCPAAEDDCLPQFRSDITPDPSGQREVKNLKVFCHYKDFGCMDQVKWKDLEDHANKCSYRPIECLNKRYGCSKQAALVDMQYHMANECDFRLVQCQYCLQQITMKHQNFHVQEECPNVQLTCPYDCRSDPMIREQLNKHKQECVYKPKECKFKAIGCEFVGTEESVAYHMLNELNLHLEKITVYTSNMELQSLTTRRQLQEVTDERNQLQRQMEALSRDNAIMQSQIEKLNKDNKDLKLKMVNLTERVLHLEKQSETVAKKDVVDRHDRDVRTMQTSLTQVRAQVVQLERQSVIGGGGSADGASVTELKRRIGIHDTQFAQIDVQMAELDLRFQILETASYDGTLMWKLRDYSRRKQDAIAGRTLSLYSQPFYSHRYGYKMCARVYLNGDGMGKGSHLSLFFVVMRGEYDSLLPWPFQQKVTMTLLDQDSGQTPLSDSFKPDPTSSSFQKPTTDMNIASGCPLFVSHTVLETPKFIKDDTLMIKFLVDLSNLNHP